MVTCPIRLRWVRLAEVHCPVREGRNLRGKRGGTQLTAIQPTPTIGATQGVTLIALDEGTQLSGLQRIVENDANPDIAADASPEPTGGDEPPAEENS